MYYKIYKNRNGFWVVEAAKPHPHRHYMDWEYLETFQFRWMARLWVRLQLRGSPKPEERFTEIW